MRGFDLASPSLAAMMFCGFCVTAGAQPGADPDAAWQQADDLASLMLVLDGWLDANAGIARRDAAPSVQVIGASLATSLNGPPARGHGRPRGLYDAATSTIYLVEPWDPDDAMDASVLLHELAHHRQATQRFHCPGAQEEAAYRLQDAWLAERGLQADVNWIAVILEARCSPRDFHPD